MKRYAVTLFIAVLTLALVPALSGCGSDNTSSDNSTPDISSTTPQSTDSEPSSQQTTVSDIISLPESSDNSSTINDLRTQIVSTAEALVGVDYVSGMATPEQGFDNSGLIYYVLRENGFIHMEDGFITLTEKGLEIAQTMYERHTVLSHWLISLGVDEKIAVEDACRMEHTMSPESFTAIKTFITQNQN